MLTQGQCSKLFFLAKKPAKKSMFFMTEEAKETILDFSQGTVRVL